MSSKIKNMAIIAHVDHGKTTLVDGLLQDSGAFAPRAEVSERVMDSGDIEKERGITITAKNCAIYWNDIKINLLDTPGHADFGGEVERSLMMVDGAFLLVDASEGPLPQTRFVLQKALERGIKIGLIINKIDRPDERCDEVKNEVEDLLLELIDLVGVEDFDLDFPVIYASAKNKTSGLSKDEQTNSLTPILDVMATDYFPVPDVDKDGDLQMLVTNLSYSPYLGNLAIGRIQRGTINKNAQYTRIGRNDSKKNFKASNIKVFDKLEDKEVDEAVAGDIIILAGMNEAEIGDTIASQSNPEALPRVEVDPPTVSVNVSVSTSPLSGREGEYLTSRKLQEFLEESCLTNVSLSWSSTDDPKIFKLMGRGELQLAIVFEELRRKGYEFMLSRPEVLFKDEDGERTEPFERVVLDVPNDCTGSITEGLAKRKGLMEVMQPLGVDRTRMEFTIPSRGLIGYRGLFLNQTRGEGIMSSYFVGYKPYAGDMLARTNGAIISDRNGKSTPYALYNLLSSGEQFIKPGEEVYEGMVIGEHTRQNDLNVNCVREKHLSSVRTAGKDENIILPPIRPRTLDWSLDWIDNDEWVEVTPQNIRIRKKVLKQNERSVVRK